ncbi:hypothetical protein PVAP13_3NG128403 [Panicum virgatum]|uniref:Uncharacterized protein n=1 Tax=Panicum virgatum TaxID=38727 RepID=A0A8T0UEX7_PANVG|nr:hypothetical protein PVAP13_3NG128403 [Panicum virgatum]
MPACTHCRARRKQQKPRAPPRIPRPDRRIGRDQQARVVVMNSKEVTEQRRLHALEFRRGAPRCPLPARALKLDGSMANQLVDEPERTNEEARQPTTKFSMPPPRLMVYQCCL